jgi:hypothetical protein
MSSTLVGSALLNLRRSPEDGTVFFADPFIPNHASVTPLQTSAVLSFADFWSGSMICPTCKNSASENIRMHARSIGKQTTNYSTQHPKSACEQAGELYMGVVRPVPA